MNIRTVLTFLLFITQAACEPQRTQEINFDKLGFNASKPKDEIEHQTESDTTFVVMQEYAEGFSYDMKYATDDNFLKRKVYSCDKCMIRKEVANKLIAANDSLINLGFRIKFFDCYRPVDVQKLMWKIYPKPGYVANPYTSGSIHNRGGAVDITLVRLDGKEVEMGTAFDFFGKEANHDFTDLPENILKNRKLLKEVMESFSFKSIRTEWWHYNFINARQYALSNFQTDCNY